MGTVVLPKLNQTGTNEWADVEDNDKALRDEFNGNIENVNIKSTAAIAHSKLANATAGYALVANASGVITATANPSALALTLSQSVSNNTATAISLGAESWDTNGIHSTSVNTSRMTIATAGIYRYDGQIVFPGQNATNARVEAYVRLNGATTLSRSGGLKTTITSVDECICVGGLYSLVATDYLELYAFHSMGSSATVTASLSVVRVGAAA